MKKIINLVSFWIFAAFIITCFTACSDDSDKAIEVVKNGYLGECTDMTVSEILEGYYGLMYDEIEWDGGTTDKEKLLVQVKFSDSSELFGTIQVRFPDRRQPAEDALLCSPLTGQPQNMAILLRQNICSANFQIIHLPE